MKNILFRTSALAIVIFSAQPALAQTSGYQTNQDLLKRIEKLEAELSGLRTAVRQSVQTATEARQVADKAETTAAKVQKAVKKVAKTAKSAEEWKNTNSIVHLAGYASAGYTNKQSASGTFNQVQFPRFFIIIISTRTRFYWRARLSLRCRKMVAPRSGWNI